jgi:molecular chaperone DnaK
MASFVGIDLGTTYSVISYIDDTGRPKVVANSEGEHMTASCIAFEGATVSDIGTVAKRALGTDDSVVGRFKRDIGSSKKYTINGKKYTPTALSAEILKKLYFDAKDNIGEINEAVITVPASFTNEQRVETKKAAKLAGIKVNHMIDEPTAAALYYAYERGGALKGHYAVFDLGGGTFDISIVKIDGFEVEVVATDGLPKLGGDDFDASLQKIIKKKFKKNTKEEIEEEDFTRSEAEDEKKSLSKRDIKIRIDRKFYAVSMSEFEDEISSLVVQTEMICGSVLESANLKLSDIKEVFLAGGSTRIPLVYESVKRAFKMDPTKTINVDEIVSLGASIYAAYKGDRSKLNSAQKASIEKISVEDITPAYFGCIVSDIDKEREEWISVVSIVIDKNRKRPCSNTKTYYIPFDNCPKIHCRITQSLSLETDPDFVNIIWEGYLEPLPKDNSQGDPIEVTYSYDDNGIMHGSFVDLNSGVKKEISISDLEATGDSITID